MLPAGTLGHARRPARGPTAGVMPPTDSPPRRHARLVRLLWLFTLVLVLISVAMVMHRTLSLFGLISTSSALSGSAPLDAAFTQYAPLTMLHILPGLLFVVLGPLKFVRIFLTRPH